MLFRCSLGHTTQVLVNLLNANKNSSSSLKSQTNRDRGQIGPCRYCGGQNPRGKGLAYGKSSAKCGRVNHFAKDCEQPTQQQTHQGMSKRFDKQAKNTQQQQTSQ